MTQSIREALLGIAHAYAEEVVHAIRAATVAELEQRLGGPVGPTKRESSELRAQAAREIPSPVAVAVENEVEGDLAARILQSLEWMGTPMSAATIAEDLEVEQASLTPRLRALVQDGRVVKIGERRATVYSLP